MPVVFHTGFEFGDSNGLEEQETVTPPISETYPSDTPNSGTYYRRTNHGTGDDTHITTTFAHADTAEPLTAGMAFRIENISTNTVDYAGIQVGTLDGAGYFDVVAINVQDDGSANLIAGYNQLGEYGVSSITTLDAGVSIGTGTFVEGQWYYLELHVTFHATLGSIKVDVDGVEQISLTNQDLDDGPGAFGVGDVGVASWYLQGGTTSPFAGNYDLDDLYVGRNLAGTLGPQVHEALAPTSTVENDGLGSDGNSVDNHLLVDEVPFSGTDDVVLSTALDRERYGFSDRTETGDINAVTLVADVYNSAGGIVDSNLLIESSASEVDSATGLILPATAVRRRLLATEDPNTAAAWTTGGVNAMTAGVEIGSLG